MSLPGKLCIGILEEDNPLKSYFRFKPLLVDRDGSYAPFEEHQRYGDEGCIRIVPDKNESYHFKTRMRRMGLFCVVDLRAHPDENDKIRPNKNYREGGPEINASIIYSDVVREPAKEMIFQILPGPADALQPIPHTASVLLRGEALYPERYGWEPVEEGDRARLVPTDKACAADSVQVFDLPGFRGETISFAIVPAARMPQVVYQPEPHAEPRPHAPEPAPEARPTEPRAAEPAPKQPAPEPAAPAAPEKPWLAHEAAPRASQPDPRMTPQQRILAAQTGLNPRRGRSLQELVDEKWQRSRLSQMGNAASELATGMPVQSPVESAVSAVREAWAQPQLRADLLSGLSGIEEFGASLQECREAVRQQDIALRLDALEARRLALLQEQDELNRANAALRQRLKEEIRRDEADRLADAVQRTEAAKQEQRRYEALAEEARAAAADARQLVDSLTGEALERRLKDFALNKHMAERLAQLQGEAEPLPEPIEVENIPLDTLVDRVVARFEAEGYTLERLQALNLCVCLGISPALMLGGPVGCGKTETARLLLEALGWTQAGRTARVNPEMSGKAVNQTLETLRSQPGVPAAVLQDDANTALPEHAHWHLSTGLPDAWRLVMTAQDAHSGHFIPANVLDRVFAIRLAPQPGTRWQPRRRQVFPEVKPVDLNAVFQGLPEKPDTAVPAACVARMDELLKALSELGASVSRRALDDAWRFTGIMVSSLGDSTDPLAILDLAMAQRILPGLLADAPLGALAALPGLLKDFPCSSALLNQPLPIEI